MSNKKEPKYLPDSNKQFNKPKNTSLTLNIETLILVAVWQQPFIFQGCFQITQSRKEEKVLFFFDANQIMQSKSIFIRSFSLSNTHLYNELGLILLNSLKHSQENALYILKYALHTTLKEMLSSRKLHFTAIDETAMQALINKVRPILDKELSLPEEEHIGFAVTMDFYAQEEITLTAATVLLNQFKNAHPAH